MKLTNKQYKIVSIILVLLIIFTAGCSNKEEQPSVDNLVQEQEEVIDKVSEEVTAEEVKDKPKDIEEEPIKQDIELVGNIEVHFIDVGQADSILIKHGEDELLIDTGTNSSGTKVVDYIENLGIDTLEYVIGTHPHEDHIGGLDDVINSINIEKVIMPKVAHTTKTYEDVLTTIQNNGLKITSPKVGDKYILGGAEFVILSPNNSEYKDLNNYSVSVKVTYGNNKFIFTGDAELLSENEMVGNGLNLSADVLKVGHHGSDTSTSDNFLNKVNPEYAVISVGKDNKYGHPSDTVLGRLQSKGIGIFRTDLQGTVVATGNGKSIVFNMETLNNIEEEYTEEVEIKEVVEPIKERDNIIKLNTYIGHKTSKKFHKESCGSLPSIENRVYLESRDEAISEGYTPCGNCKP